MEQELEMRPTKTANIEGKSDTAGQRPCLERNVSSAEDGKRRTKLRMGAIITALFVRGMISANSLHFFVHAPPTNSAISSPSSSQP
jgi:hypothetical protein